jgi:hypothetical protein
LKIIQITSLPVYRLTRDEYYAQLNQFIEKTIFGVRDGEFKREYALKNPEWLSTYMNHLRKLYGGAWEYNEIIGYIDLHFMGNQVRGTYCQDNKKRFVRSRKKQFVYITHKLAPEVSFDRKSNNSDIFLAIQTYVEDCRKELNKRYIDDSNLLNMGQFVDWRAMLKRI